MDGSRIILAAHRGDRFHCPENTMPAFEASLAAGVDMIETDIRMTADGELVIMHDRSALRTTGTDRFIDEMTLEEVKALDAGHLKSDAFRSVTVPTVAEFLDLIRDTNVLVNWELKVFPNEFGDDYAFAVADKLISVIEEAGMGERSMVNSFSARVLEHVYKTCGHRYPIHGQGIHLCRRSNDTADTPEEEIFTWCCLYANQKNTSPVDYKENFDYCTDRGILPCVCIPDMEESYAKAIANGCRMFTSNNIYEADIILRRLGVR